MQWFCLQTLHDPQSTRAQLGQESRTQDSMLALVLVLVPSTRLTQINTHGTV